MTATAIPQSERQAQTIQKRTDRLEATKERMACRIEKKEEALAKAEVALQKAQELLAKRQAELAQVREYASEQIAKREAELAKSLEQQKKSERRVAAKAAQAQAMEVVAAKKGSKNVGKGYIGGRNGFFAVPQAVASIIKEVVGRKHSGEANVYRVEEILCGLDLPTSDFTTLFIQLDGRKTDIKFIVPHNGQPRFEIVK
jgi:chromosome segregation ATPase